MSCHLCQAEAVTRCHSCGQLVCAEHGKGTTCAGCTTAFVSGNPRGDRISVEPIETKPHHGWWRPQQADEYSPPACYACQGLTRAICRNCGSKYCFEHAGPNGLCQECGRSAMLSVYVLFGIAVVFTLFLALHWIFGLPQ